VSDSAASPLRVLCVEDDRINALLFEEALKMHSDTELLGPVELRMAEDGAQALSIAQGWRPDVLVIDAHLPDTHGIALLRRLRALPGLASVPAFMCSADAMPEDVRSAMKAGFSGYWTKPIDIDRVAEELRKLQ
jgi:CheY-like chemotaxis protein